MFKGRREEFCEIGMKGILLILKPVLHRQDALLLKIELRVISYVFFL